MSLSQSAFKLAFELSPIIFHGGIAKGILGGYLPIISITESLNFVEGILSSGSLESLDDYFCHFSPLPGATLIDQQIGHYPFANQTVAANAVITQPLRISLRMICPVKSPGGYAAKLATFLALQYAVSRHNSFGGTYIIATPSFLYTNCVMLSLRDVSGGESKQVQNAWQWDFEQPLLSLASASAAQSASMDAISRQIPTTGITSGPAMTVGQAITGAGPVTVPALANQVGGSVLGAASGGLY